MATLIEILECSFKRWLYALNFSQLTSCRSKTPFLFRFWHLEIKPQKKRRIFFVKLTISVFCLSFFKRWVMLKSKLHSTQKRFSSFFDHLPLSYLSLSLFVEKTGKHGIVFWTSNEIFLLLKVKLLAYQNHDDLVVYLSFVISYVTKVIWFFCTAHCFFYSNPIIFWIW